ncbi:hypothetical protein QFZ42_004327 [Variovorax paradoxus]|jgi:hypothetical protein|uniref:DUF2474 domain-containing protein n=1 Tax=Variovorax paradoxus TaxID=34073 RepID=UPI00278EF874|nr:DUF2474 domain-containing protein [Variovorax paradoxus]MDQ0572493.1 hypothetical protein [Variovorax paradoxus]
MATTEPGAGGRSKWMRRLGWLLAIWLASVGSLFAVALVFRWLMRAVGLTAP